MNENIDTSQHPNCQEGCQVSIERLENGRVRMLIPLALFGKSGLRKLQDGAAKTGMSLEDFLMNAIMHSAENHVITKNRKEA